LKKTYSTPVLTERGDIRKITASGSPNEAFDAGSIFDFFGPEAS
jgi:hypothetical protein